MGKNLNLAHDETPTIPCCDEEAYGGAEGEGAEIDNDADDGGYYPKGGMHRSKNGEED